MGFSEPHSLSAPLPAAVVCRSNYRGLYKTIALAQIMHAVKKPMAR
jgi:hypothetical protein